MKFAIVMNMDKIITVTSKGQTTLPTSLRSKLGIPTSGGKVKISFNDKTGQIIISKPPTFDEITKKASLYLDPSIPPLENIDTYYQKHRRRLK